MLSSISIVLVNTSHPGNIGATARAMKNMGLSNLCLVNPQRFPADEATARAAGADDILINAKISNSLEEAIQDFGLIIGTSARIRGIPWPLQELRPAAQQIIQEAKQTQVAILFGQESSGLTNEELAHCHFMVSIPANPDFSSLNLAQAVQIVCYEILMAAQAEQKKPATEEPVYILDQLATAEEMQQFYDYLQQALIATDFLKPENPRKLMRRIMRLFNRARLEKRELNILRGILGSFQLKYNTNHDHDIL